jgi:hypothetical protein
MQESHIKLRRAALTVYLGALLRLALARPTHADAFAALWLFLGVPQQVRTGYPPGSVCTSTHARRWLLRPARMEHIGIRCCGRRSRRITRH